MDTKPFIISIAVFFLTFHLLSAQESKIDSTIPVVTWNSKLNSFDKELPFDREFYIKIVKKKEQRLTDFTIKGSKKPQKGKRGRTFTRLEGKRIREVYRLQKTKNPTKELDEKIFVFSSKNQNKNQSEDSIFIKIEDIIIATNDTEVFAKIFPLNPNSFYGFSYTLELDGKIPNKDVVSASEIINKDILEIESIPTAVATFNKVIYSIDTTLFQQTSSVENTNFAPEQSILEAAVQEELNERQRSIDSNNANTSALEDSINLVLTERNKNQAIYDTIKKHYRQGRIDLAIEHLVVNEQVDKVTNKRKYNFRNRFAKLGTYEIIFNSDDATELSNFYENYYNDIIKSIVECNSCDNRNAYQNLTNDDIRPYLIPSTTDSTKKYIVQGRLPINYQSIDSLADMQEIARRRKYVVATIDFLENLFKFNWYDNYSRSNTILKEFISKKENLEKHLNESRKLSQDLISYSIQTDENENKKPFAEYIIEESGSTTGSDLTTKSKSKFTVRPDIGVGIASNIITTKDRSNPFLKVVPFFGVRFNLRPIDPDYPLRQVLYKNFWHRSSINISYSPASISNNSTRFDLYGSNNFLLGYGYRINNAFNLSAGALLFRRKTPESPFVNDKKLAAMPYVAITLDFDIVNTLKSIANAFGAQIP
jgi:hypothetical protein